MAVKNSNSVPQLLVIEGGERPKTSITLTFDEQAIYYGDWFVLDGKNSQASFVDPDGKILTVAPAARVYEIAHGKKSSTISQVAAEIALGYLPEDVQESLKPDPLGI